MHGGSEFDLLVVAGRKCDYIRDDYFFLLLLLLLLLLLRLRLGLMFLLPLLFPLRGARRDAGCRAACPRRRRVLQYK